MATPSLSALAAAAANAVNAARAAQREGEPFRMPIYAPLPGEQWADSHEHMHLSAVRQWSHPFGSKADPLRQLTELANAKSGYYPLGRNGIWHTGVHFDAGTAGILDQSFVRCLADGEVVAYRIDSQAPANEYTVNRQLVKRPFARNFVLVRHRLQAPKIAGSDDIPPSLTFYSLYMHLQDWSAYQLDPSLKRPAFWPPSKNLRVKNTEHDHVPGLDGLVWLRTRIGPNGGAIVSGLARGTEVTVSGTGSYRKLENLAGPRQLLSDGALQGYVRFGHLVLINGNEYRATHDLDVLVSADTHAQRLMKLPLGTVVRISGEGAYRKLEWVNQYVHFASLLSEPEPQERDCCVVLDEPVPIKAGALIGHLGQYHKCFADEPTQQLHLEVFSGQNVGGFIHFCREWAKRLPASSKTWLPLPKGTPIAPDRADLSAARYPIVDADTPRSAAELYLPKSLLDGLKTEHKLAIPAKDGRKACTWYRLENLLHDEQNQLQSGWVKVEADAQWVSPWEWPGYDVIYNRDTPQRCVAYRQQTTMERLNDQARERYSQMADLSDQGPVRSRLFEIIDRNRDGRMTADELQKALELPAHAQSISRLVIHCENEWHWNPQKWNELDEILGHTPSTPHTNWFSEKSRIEQMCWWNEVAAKVGLPVDGRVWHFHPIGGVGNFLKPPRRINYSVMYSKKGWAYKDEQIKEYSHYRHPIDISNERVSGNSRVHGDISEDGQRAVIDIIADLVIEQNLSKSDLAMILAITHVESGFNPDAAAGTTSAAGLGQFVDGTAKAYGIFTNEQRFDAEIGAHALIQHYLENKKSSEARYSGREMYTMIYALHHDGPSLAYGGKEISEREVMPKFDIYIRSIGDEMFEY
ncbi:transglycosylase SLT domain-containing protein [Pseudomonas sp. QL9]|uniref:transglycosylase SLT domain-containing protein n=1 Tax=Pseudomonas sp. QL9 TaxID=3242725 RepID=UPI00352BA0FB